MHSPSLMDRTRCYQTCVLGALFCYYCWHRLGCSPLDVLSRPSSLDLSLMPSFYNSVLAAWQKVNGRFSNPSDTLVICASDGLFQQDVSSVST